MPITRFNLYQIMWTIVLFDLPTETKLQRKEAARFRKALLADGFSMFQYSIYIRHSPSRENSEVHIQRAINSLPEEGHICIFSLTDKQFGNIIVFDNGSTTNVPDGHPQVELF